MAGDNRESLGCSLLYLIRFFASGFFHGCGSQGFFRLSKPPIHYLNHISGFNVVCLVNEFGARRLRAHPSSCGPFGGVAMPSDTSDQCIWNYQSPYKRRARLNCVLWTCFLEPLNQFFLSRCWKVGLKSPPRRHLISAPPLTRELSWKSPCSRTYRQNWNGSQVGIST